MPLPKLTPQFQHDCDRCVLVHQAGALDIYVCPRSGKAGDRAIETVISRSGNEGDRYASGLEFAMRGPDGPDDVEGRALNTGLAIALRDGYRLPRGIYGKVFVDFGWAEDNRLNVSFVTVKDDHVTVYGGGRIKSFSKWG